LKVLAFVLRERRLGWKKSGDRGYGEQKKNRGAISDHR